MGRTRWCQVQVLKNGRLDWPYEYAKVSGATPGFFGGSTSTVRTDSRGIATLQWSSGDYLEKIYVSGQTFNGPFEDGRSYTLRYEV